MYETADHPVMLSKPALTKQESCKKLLLRDDPQFLWKKNAFSSMGSFVP